MSFTHRALELDHKKTPLDQLIEKYLRVVSHRPETLFRNFLPRGYFLTTLNTVPADFKDSVILAKIHLGMIITLYDDLADHPRHRRPQLLKRLYLLNLGESGATFPTSAEDTDTVELAKYLFRQLQLLLQNFPNYGFLIDVLKFDIEQFYNCNRLSTLTSLCPEVTNLSESRMLGPHNMGIVAAGTIDLMASCRFIPEELGLCREIFLLAQRMGRISNVLFTYDREIAEGDLTNELFISQKMTGADPKFCRYKIQEELQLCHDSICELKLDSFLNSEYAAGFMSLHQLHSDLVGQI